MIKEVENFSRQALFNHYNSFDNPFMYITTKIEVTNLVNYCKIHRHFYATLGYLITKTANQIDCFKYRAKDGKIYYCDEVFSNYTQMYDDHTIGYFSLPSANSYYEYIENFVRIQDKFLKDKKYSAEKNMADIWLSSQPWFSYTGFVPVFSKDITIPQFLWDKYEELDKKYYIHLTIMVHHGFADGYHIGEFLKLLNENIKLFDN